MEVKRSTQFEKTMSLGVNVIRVINDIQPFSDDELSQVGTVQNVRGGGLGALAHVDSHFALSTASKKETLAYRNDVHTAHR